MVNTLPEIEKDPFPNGYIRTNIEDKLFKHVLFHTDKKFSKFRIKSIGQDWTELLEATTGELKIPLADWDFTKDKVRIKAVLNEPKYGVLESDWVSQKVLGEMKKQKLNQFRIRGISDTGLRSRWLYSELKDNENDLVVFQLLHDIIDLMTVAHEKDFTVLLETHIHDTLIGLMNGGRMDDVDWVNTLELEEEVKYRLTESIKAEGMGVNQVDLLKHVGVNEQVINELMRGYIEFKDSRKLKIEETATLVARHFKKNLMEQKKFSAQDMAEHAHLYSLKDIKNDKILEGMLDYILLLTLEDSYERAIEECNLVALLHNDEELLLLLTDMYKFKAESSMAELFLDVEFVENFVTFFGDGLSLLLEPTFDEIKLMKVREEAVPVLLLIYREVYIPLSILDKTMAELFLDLTDSADSMHERTSSLLSAAIFEHYNEETGETWTSVEEFLIEIFDYLILTDDYMEKEVFIELFSTMMGSLKTDSLRLLITYDPVEAVEFITQLLENINISNSIENTMKSEKYNLYLREQASTQNLIYEESIKDIQKLTRIEDLLLQDTRTFADKGEIYTIRNGEKYKLINTTNLYSLLEAYSILMEEGYTLQDILSNEDIFTKYNLRLLSDEKIEDTRTYLHFMTSHYVAVLQTLIVNKSVGELEGAFNVPAYAQYHLDLLYKQNLADLFTGPFVRRENEEEFEVAEMFPVFYRFDDYFNFIWNIKEDVHVHLGELDLIGTRFPLGYFELGKNTLEGEIQPTLLVTN